jgi:xanthine dehydrogenase YagS FAD-binding subunit
MSHPSDLAPALIALDAQVHVYGGGTERAVPIEKFFVGPRNVEETVLKSNELISRITVPEPNDRAKSIFLKSRIRNTWDFALASAAVSMNLDQEGRAKEVRVVLGGVAPFPFRARAAEIELEGKKPNDESIERAAQAGVQKSQPLKMNAYKVKLIKSLIKRAINNLAEKFE